MPNPGVQFKRGLLSQLPVQKTDGTIYVTTDEESMYIDVGTQRIRIGDFIPVNTLTDLNSIPATNLSEKAMYYVKENNILARWDATNNRWIQINKAGVVGVTNTGTGSVVSDIRTVVNSENGTLQLEVTKVEVATPADLESLASRMATAEGKLTTITGGKDVEGSMLNIAAAVETALLGGETQYPTLKELGDAIRAVKQTADKAATDISSLQTDVSNLSTTVSGHTTVLNKLDGDENTTGSVLQLIKAERDARTSVDGALDDRLDDVEGDVNSLGTRMTTVEATANANKSAIEILNKTDGTAGSVKKTVDDAIAEIIANAPEDFDTLKEISDWISTHASSAADMNSAIQQNTLDISGLASRVSTAETNITSIGGRVTTAEEDIDDLQSDVTKLNGDDTTVGSVDYKIKQAKDAVDSDISGLASRVSTAESKLTTLQGDASTPGSVAYAVAQEQAAREAADTALGARIDSAEGRLDTAEEAIDGLNNSVSSISTRVTTIEDKLTWKDFVTNANP